MSTVFQLLESCSDSEKSKLLQYVCVKNSPKSKKCQLLRLMIGKPELQETEYARAIYQKEDMITYSQLKRRLTEDLISLVVLVKTNRFHKKECLRSKITELILRSQHLFHLELEKEGIKALKKALELAGNQGYTDLVLCIHETARSAGVAEPISKNELIRLKNALCNQLELTFTNTKTELENHKGNFISLKKSVLQTESNNEVLNLLEKSEMLLGQNRLTQASIAIQDAENILYSYPSINQPEMIWKVNLTQQQILLKYAAYDELINNCQKTLGIKNLPENVKLEVYKNEWFAAFYLKETQLAKQILLKLAGFKSGQNTFMWQYFESYLLFQQGEMAESLTLNHECQRNLKSNPDFLLGSKLLEMMILIEKNEWDWMEFKLESFRKSMYSFKGKVHDRIKSFFYALQFLQKQYLISNPSEIINFQHFQLLKNSKESFSWEPGTYEIIPYHGWIEGLIQPKFHVKTS